MNWQRKAQIQSVLSRAPLGEKMNYLLQRHVTKSLPVGDGEFVSRAEKARKHLDMMAACGGGSIEDATFYEFGAGWDMIVPLAFYGHGVQRQILIDIRALIRVDLINDTISRLQRLPLKVPLARLPEKTLDPGNPLASLKQFYGIEYQAPLDARATGWKVGSIDFITSSNTLEHIPRAELAAILRECHRLLTPDGLMSFRVDYQDHYSLADPTVSIYNFLQYSEEEWARYNPALHYQNRMRHRDYLELYEDAGFEVALEDRWLPSAEHLDTLQQIPLAEPLRSLSLEELAIRGATVVLRKRRASG